jgi:hypothetical protein
MSPCAVVLRKNPVVAIAEEVMPGRNHRPRPYRVARAVLSVTTSHTCIGNPTPVEVPGVLCVVLVMVVCLKAELAVDVAVNVRVVVVGISARKAAFVQSAVMPASHAVCAAASVAVLVDTARMVQGKLESRSPPAEWR